MMSRAWVPALGFLITLGIALVLIVVVTLRPWGGPDHGWNTHLNFGGPPGNGYGRTPLSWVSSEPGPLMGWHPAVGATGDEGEILYMTAGCASCHGLDAAGTKWAPLEIKQAGRVRLLVRSGPEGMPAYPQEYFSERNLETLAAWLLDKKGVAPEVAKPSPSPSPAAVAPSVTPTALPAGTPTPAGAGFRMGGVRARFATAQPRFAFPGDWSAVPAATVTLFYPGESSWEWLTSTSHRGRRDTTSGAKPCSECHADDAGEKFLGEDIVKGGANLETAPIQGKNPWTDVQVQAAYDATNLYLRLEWATQNPEPGIYAGAWRFDGKEWVMSGGPAPYKTPAISEDRISVMFGNADLPAADGSTASFGSAGCFITCHNPMNTMSSAPTVAQVQADPYFGAAGLGASDVRKYILLSRTEPRDPAGAWSKVKPKSDLDQLKAAGKFLDLLSVRMHRSAIQGWADDSSILEFRHDDEGKAMFREAAAPDRILDQTRFDTTAFKLEDFNKDGVPFFARDEDKETWKAWDAAIRSWQEGQALPAVVLQDPDGSRADVQATATFANGRWTVEIKRPLNTGHKDDLPLTAGKTYTVGIAVHDANVAGRQHFVSFPISLGLGAPGKLAATALK